MALIHLSTLITAGLIPTGASAVWSWIVTFNWGSFPDYLAGTGAILALWFARKAALAAKAANVRQDEQLKLLIADKQSAEEEARRGQADMFAIWADQIQGELVYRLSNASRQPLYDVYMWHSLDKSNPYLVRVAPPGEYYVIGSQETDVGVGLSLNFGVRVQYEFTDHRRNLWRRQRNGMLCPIERITAHDSAFVGTLHKFPPLPGSIDPPPLTGP